MALRDCSKEMIARLKVTGLADMPEPFWNEVRKLLFSDCETKQENFDDESFEHVLKNYEQHGAVHRLAHAYQFCCQDDCEKLPEK
mmetsp:Transcript_40991/g.88837  ORF Transcript_40991/g.88837 Transcript_40991/m.88837 type:complete len:85 (-) Transcript_40991:60-314(-)